MNLFAIAFFIISAIALLSLPKRWAPLPLLIGACYMSRGEGIEIGAISLPVIRLMIMVGFIRVIFKGEIKSLHINFIDKLMFSWSLIALVTSLFHQNAFNSLITRMGVVYNNLGIYTLIRIFCSSMGDIVSLCRTIGILMFPLALEMLRERMTGQNLFSFLGGVSELVEMRENGTFRAEGPFSHSILAGTVGAVCFPLMIAIWKNHRWLAMIGIGSCFMMVYASNSTGPIMSLFIGIFGLLMWKYRLKMKVVLSFFAFCFLFLLFYMNDPPYFILARIDISGGSTGWYRAKLIDQAIKHLPEWWLWGTDYTRHWMLSGVAWSAEHTDITNYYLKMGVWGGLPLMFAFIAIISFCYVYLNKTIHAMERVNSKYQFFTWAIWSMLLSHTGTCIAVSYYDQSFIFIFMTFAIISTISNIKEEQY